jgi:hypothetical protein
MKQIYMEACRDKTLSLPKKGRQNTRSAVRETAATTKLPIWKYMEPEPVQNPRRVTVPFLGCGTVLKKRSGFG